MAALWAQCAAQTVHSLIADASSQQNPAHWMLFDLGNVLVGFEHRRISQGLHGHIRQTRPNSTVEPEDLHDFLFATFNGSGCRNDRVDRGEQTLSELREELCAHFGFEIDQAHFEEIWNSIFVDPDMKVERCLVRVSGLGVKIGICSNTNPVHWDFLVSKIPNLIRVPDRHFLSYEMKRSKPEPEYFEEILRITKSPPHCHLLIDDREDNIAAANGLGLHTILAQPFVPCDEIIAFAERNRWD